MFDTALTTLKSIKHALFSSKKMVFYRCFFENFKQIENLPPNFNFRIITPSDYQRLEELLTAQWKKETVFHPLFDLNEAIDRIDQGEYCCICEENDRIIAYTWFSPGRKYIKEIDSTVCLEDKWCYAYNAYVDQNYRGQDLMKILSLTCGRKLFEGGHTGAIACRMDWNLSAHRNLMKIGYSEIGYVRTGYFLTLRYRINTCKNLSIVNDHGPFHIYRKMLDRG